VFDMQQMQAGQGYGQRYNPFEYQLGSYLYGSNPEKTYIDKLIARGEVEEIKEIMQKDDLTRNDLLRTLYLLAANEIKLVNFGEWERYLLGKYYAWIRDFVASAEILYDYRDKIEAKDSEIKINENTKKMLENVRVKMLHNIKFLCDVYLFLSRSTLSLGATAFDTISKNRYEYAYPGYQQQQVMPEQKRGMFNITMRGR